MRDVTSYLDGVRSERPEGEVLFLDVRPQYGDNQVSVSVTNNKSVGGYYEKQVFNTPGSGCANCYAQEIRDIGLEMGFEEFKLFL